MAKIITVKAMASGIGQNPFKSKFFPDLSINIMNANHMATFFIKIFNLDRGALLVRFFFMNQGQFSQIFRGKQSGLAFFLNSGF